MKREAQPTLSVEGQQAFDHYARALKQVENLSAVTIRNHPSDPRQFMAWCEGCWREARDEQPFTPQAVALPLLIRYRTYLQTKLWLKPSSVNWTLMSLKRYFAWATTTQIIRHDPASTVKFVLGEDYLDLRAYAYLV